MRRPLPAVCFVLGIFALLPSRSAAFTHDHRHDDPALLAIEAAHRAGTLGEDEALMLAMQRIFDPESLPAAYAAPNARPIRCASPIVEAARTADLTPADRARVEAWLTPRALARRAAYVTPEGHFTLDYVVSGSNTVPLDDIDPANGVPDYVERVGSYFEESWDVEFDQLGFAAPDLSGGPYRVLLRRIGAYGFTERTDDGTAGTQITVHNSFLNFPPNDDPEGDQLGAAKVTAAHELKHASQFTNNGWTEPGLWIEIDATWTEDIVYDQVNDFYNYIGFRSPITDPPRPLDDGGSGAYAEAIWQHWMSESLGIGAIVDFWDRRAAAPQEGVMQSYDAVLSAYGPPLAESWVDFASWNYATGTNVIAGFGYEEAIGFPTAPLTDGATTVPASFSGAVERLAAHFLGVSGFRDDEMGVVVLTPQLATSSPLRARVVVERRDGTQLVESVAMESGKASELQTPLEDIAQITVILGHGDLQQGPALYELTVDQEVRRPTAQPLFDLDAVRSRVAVGGNVSRRLAIENVGASGSVLDFEAVIVPADVELPAVAPERSISGSDLTFSADAYEPGTEATLPIEVTNRSIDFEWLKAVEIRFPPGIEVLGANDFLAPESRALVVDAATGDGATVTWTDPDGAWGNVRNGESAVASVVVAFGRELHGDLVVSYTLTGDGFGTGSSTVEGAVLLRGPSTPLVEVETPSRVVRSGDVIDLSWSAAIDGAVAIDLSRDGGASWDVLAASIPNDGSFEWTATGPTSFAALLRVRDAADELTFGLSPSIFTIAETIAWAEVSPSKGTLPVAARAEVDVAFDATNLAAGVYEAKLALVYDGMLLPALLDVELDVRQDGTSSPTPQPRAIVFGARPNPFNPVTRVAFELNQPSHVRIDVYDAKGRHLRTVVDGDFAVGEHEVPWTGIDEQGRRVGSGVYLYTVDVEGERTIGKVGLVK